MAILGAPISLERLPSLDGNIGRSVGPKDHPIFSLFYHFCMSSLPNPIATTLSSDAMRTEAEFLEQAELARAALQQFIAVKDFDNADEMKRSALNKLMKTTVRLLHVL